MKVMKISRADYDRQRGNARKTLDIGIKNGWVKIIEPKAAPTSAQPSASPVAVVSASTGLLLGHWLDRPANDNSQKKTKSSSITPVLIK